MHENLLTKDSDLVSSPILCLFIYLVYLVYYYCYNYYYFILRQGLESKFMEFSFTEKHLLPSVPSFLYGSCFLGGAAVLTVFWWKYFSE